MDIQKRIAIATAALEAYDAGADVTESFVSLCHDWAVEIRPINPELADRLAAVDFR